MKSTIDTLTDIIRKEEKKHTSDSVFQAFKETISLMEKMGYSSTPTYNLPPVDTIGKTAYTNLNGSFVSHLF